jgi:hypothetical protein
MSSQSTTMLVVLLVCCCLSSIVAMSLWGTNVLCDTTNPESQAVGMNCAAVYASSGGSPASGPAPASGPTAALSTLKYDFVGEGPCIEDVASARTACAAMSACDAMGQQTNGCWHCLKTATTGGGLPTAYKKLYSLSSTGRAEQRVYANNGTVSCSRYCGGMSGVPWNNELPVAWGGSTCVSAGKTNNLACSYVGADPATPSQLECSCQKSPSTPWAA